MLAFLSDFCTIMTLLLLSVSSRQRGTLADLIIGAACSMSGHVTSCVEATCAEKHITAYYNLINRGNIDTESLFSAIVKCFINACSRLKLEHVCLIIDDTIQPRSSEKAPCVQKLKEHSQKTNRPEKITGQCWVTLNGYIESLYRRLSVPLRFALVDKATEESKLQIASDLLGAAVREIRKTRPNAKIMVMVDAWYMKTEFLVKALRLGVTVVGHLRKDSSLKAKYLGPQKGRGRPRKYDGKMTCERAMKEFPSERLNLPVKAQRKKLNGEYVDICDNQPVSYSAFPAYLEFLENRLCSFVWSQYIKKDGTLTDPRLFCSTDPNMTGVDILNHYHKRWAIEVFYFYAKNIFNMLSESWQQKIENLHTWVTILSAAYGMNVILAALHPKQSRELYHLEWRDQGPVTPGIVAGILRWNFRRLVPSALWDAKDKKFVLNELSGRRRRPPPKEKCG